MQSIFKTTIIFFAIQIHSVYLCQPVNKKDFFNQRCIHLKSKKVFGGGGSVG